MFGISNSKKTLTKGFFLMLSIGCALGSASIDPTMPSIDDHEDHDYPVLPEAKGWFSLIRENKLTSAFFLVAFAFAMVAMFADFTCVHDKAGVNLFADGGGSSRWLRLAVALPCLTLSIGAVTVFVFRGLQLKKTGQTEAEYQKWKDSDGFHLGKNKTSRYLQYIFYGALIVFAIVAAGFGYKNGGEVMHTIAWVLPACIGLFGIVFVSYKHVKSLGVQHEQQLSEQLAEKEQEMEELITKNLETTIKQTDEISKHKSSIKNLEYEKAKLEGIQKSLGQKLSTAEAKAKDLVKKTEYLQNGERKLKSEFERVRKQLEQAREKEKLREKDNLLNKLLGFRKGRISTPAVKPIY